MHRFAFIRPLFNGILISSPCLVYFNSKHCRVYAKSESTLRPDADLPDYTELGSIGKDNSNSYGRVIAAKHAPIKDAFKGIQRVLPKTLQPKPIKIAQREQDGKLLIHTDELKKVFKKAKDNPIAVYAISGISRSGKSFLLTRCLDRLMSLPSSDSASESDTSDVLTYTKNPFRWNNQADPLTSGIWIWSEPIDLILPNGQTVSIILMDCQGCFDDQTTLNEDANIFAFTTLISSVHIFNIKNQIDESLLQFLELFIGIARMIKLSINTGNSSSNPMQLKNHFQTFMILVRDFQFTGYDLGYHDNSIGSQNNYKNDKLDPKTYQPQDHQRTRANILKSFHNVSAFLMPHPGKPFIKADDPNKLDAEFIEVEAQFLSTLFSPQNIVVKTIDGVEQTGKSIQEHIEKWAVSIETAKIPKLPTTTDAISKYQFIGAVEFAKQRYYDSMESYLRGNVYRIDEDKLLEISNKYLEETISTFQNHLIIFGTYGDMDFKEKLYKYIEKTYPRFQDTNLLKPEYRWYNWIYDNGVQKVVNITVVGYKYTEKFVKYAFSFYGNGK